MTADLIAFLNARYDGAEQTARRIKNTRHGALIIAPGDGASPSVITIEGDALLADIESKRKILWLHGRMSIVPGHPMFNDAHLTREPMTLCRSCEPERMWRRERSWPCRTLRALVAPYSDHPDFDPAWSAEP